MPGEYLQIVHDVLLSNPHLLTYLGIIPISFYTKNNTYIHTYIHTYIQHTYTHVHTHTLTCNANGTTQFSLTKMFARWEIALSCNVLSIPPFIVALNTSPPSAGCFWSGQDSVRSCTTWPISVSTSKPHSLHPEDGETTALWNIPVLPHLYMLLYSLHFSCSWRQ